MVFVHFRMVDEDSLLCDFAQYYHIYSFDDYDIEYLGILASGLPADSRIMKRLSGQKLSMDSLFSAMMVDYLALLVWLTARGKKSQRPKSLLKRLIEGSDKKKDDIKSFKTSADFEAMKQHIINGE